MEKSLKISFYIISKNKGKATIINCVSAMPNNLYLACRKLQNK